MTAATEDSRQKKRRRKRKVGVLPWCRRNGFLLLLLACTVCGYCVGVALSASSLHLSPHSLHLVAFPGQLVLRAFLMIIVPLLFCSLVLGVSSLRKGGDARMVALTVCLFLGLSTLSAAMGATAGHLVHPGRKITVAQDEGLEANNVVRPRLSGRKGLILDSMLDLLWNAIPSNIIESTFIKEYTDVEVVVIGNSSTSLGEDGNVSSSLVHYKKTLRQAKGVNFMGLLTFSILFGCALASLGEKGEQLLQVVEQLNAVVMTIMGYFLKLLPPGMFFWMLREGLEGRVAPGRLLGQLGMFLATALGCMAVHQFILLPLLYVCLVRRNPLRYYINLLPAILTAFGTASSAATLPLTVKCAEEANRLNRCVTQFVLPLGMVVHMNGPTLYMPLSALFLAQLEGIDIGISETVIMCITAVILFMSVPGIPSGGNPVYLLTVMAAGGVPSPQFISLFLSVDWIMERFRTVMNVVGDSYVAAFVDRLCGKRLPQEGDTYPSPVIHGYDEATLSQAVICHSCGSSVEVMHPISEA